jgi:hypothetical protein
MFRPTSSTCSLSEGTGFCQQGTCTPTWCTGGHSNFGDFCGLQADDECKVRCQLEGACSDLDGWTWSPDRVPVNWQTDGTLCASGLGTCQSGSCVVAPADTAEAPDDPDDRFTAAGCSCRESWTYRGETCQDGCCNPDSDAGGDWCFTKGDCDGVNWGYCAASNATRPVRSNMLGGFQDEVMQTDAAYRSAAGWAGVVLLGALLGLVF